MNKMNNLSILIFPFIVFLLNLFHYHLIAQQDQDKYHLKLKTGDIKIEENASNLSNIHAAYVFKNRYYKFIQFFEIPGTAEKNSIEQFGIQLLGYIPNNTFIASIPVKMKLDLLQSSNVRAIVDIKPIFKIDPSLLEQPLPAWALYGDQEINLVLQYYQDLVADDVNEELTSLGIQVLKRNDYSNIFFIRINISDIKNVAALPFVLFMEPITPPPVHDDTKGRSLHRSNAIDADYSAGNHYDGTGVSMVLGDDGTVGPHMDYKGRIDQTKAPDDFGTHGDMTSGIMMGAGNINPTIKGMATGAFLYVYAIGEYEHITESPTTHVNNGVMVTSTSYSQQCGGSYTLDSHGGDKMIRENPSLIHVFSAGNSGNSDCNYGAGAGWGNITGGYKAAKNVIATGNLDAWGTLDNSSSRGPAKDGRIKPDICANGKNQLSTNGPNTYQVGGGTSAAAPGIAGIIAQLIHAYRDLNGAVDPESPLLKACLLNTAKDLGNPGPDFTYGWGRVNALRALRTLEENRYLSDSVGQGDSTSHIIAVPSGTKQLKIMLYWLDYEAIANASIALVNDLNMKVVSPGSTEYDPWVLDYTPNAANLDADATRGVDNRNNMEQVTIDNPVAGNYTVKVNGFAVPQGPQKYYIVYELRDDKVEVTYPTGGEPFVPGETEVIHWDAFGNTGTFALEYSIDAGGTWTPIDTTIGSSIRLYNWVVPDTFTGRAYIRISRGSESDISDTFFTILGVPQNLKVNFVCPDSIHLSWDPVSNATGYEISVLGAKYMDSVATSNDTFVIVQGLNPNYEDWLSVKALGANNAVGRRAYAILKNTGTWSCPIPIDASVSDHLSPGGGTFMNCYDYSNLAVSISITNYGLDTLTNIPINYQINGGSVISDTASGSLLPGNSTTFEFTTRADISSIGIYNFLFWASYPVDGNSYNDSITTRVNIVSGTKETLPWIEDFETFVSCSQESDCGDINCNLNNSWVNESNGIIDDIDWRPDAGGTPSGYTGPSMDHNPGTASGKYLYLEASGNCNNKEALMVSPCIDLTTMPSPMLNFWYHMLGDAIDSLHVDVLSAGVWNKDAFSISGNRGKYWQNSIIDLSAYSGEIINIRFRGTTGDDYQGDIAIDDIVLYDLSMPPITNFQANNVHTCLGEAITFTDLSLNSPTGWEWSFEPNTITYVSGSSSGSQNPMVVFDSLGTYHVTLTTTNANGNDQKVKSSYIFVGQGSVVPFDEDFENTSFPPQEWQVDNPGGSHTWDKASVIGSSGFLTTAAFVENFAYTNRGAEDGLISKLVDLRNAKSATLSFDVAYARYSNNSWEGLRVDYSIDCGATFIPTGFYKSSTSLATVSDQYSAFAPSLASHWVTHTVNLSNYIGNLIMVKFVNVNGSGNNLYIDNVNITDSLSIGIPSKNLLSTSKIVNVYPNPGDGIFNISITNTHEDYVAISVTDLVGREVYFQKFSGNGSDIQESINLSHLSSGFYCINFIIAGQQYRVKIGIQ